MCGSSVNFSSSHLCASTSSSTVARGDEPSSLWCRSSGPQWNTWRTLRLSAFLYMKHLHEMAKYYILCVCIDGLSEENIIGEEKNHQHMWNCVCDYNCSRTLCTNTHKVHSGVRMATPTGEARLIQVWGKTQNLCCWFYGSRGDWHCTVGEGAGVCVCQ